MLVEHADYQLMKVSVIIPTYRQDKLLQESLRSLYAQSLDKHDYEVIVVLNGEQQPYEARILQFAQEHSDMQLRYLYAETPGVSHARNIGLDHAVGEYIAFVDDDDFVSPTYLEELLAAASPSCISLSYFYSFDDCDNAYDNKPQQQPYSITTEYDKHAPKGQQKAVGVRRYFAGPVAKLFHRSVIGTRRFDESMANLEDVLFCFLISDRYADVVFTSRDAIYYRRMRNNSMAHRRTRWTRAKHSLRAIGKYVKVYASRPKAYNFGFFSTRILGAVKGILTQDA